MPSFYLPTVFLCRESILCQIPAPLQSMVRQLALPLWMCYYIWAVRKQFGENFLLEALLLQQKFTPVKTINICTLAVNHALLISACYAMSVRSSLNRPTARLFVLIKYYCNIDSERECCFQNSGLVKLHPPEATYKCFSVCFSPPGSSDRLGRLVKHILYQHRYLIFFQFFAGPLACLHCRFLMKTVQCVCFTK